MTIYDHDQSIPESQVEQLEERLWKHYYPKASQDSAHSRENYGGKKLAQCVLNILEAVGQLELLDSMKILDTTEKTATLEYKSFNSNMEVTARRTSEGLQSTLTITSTSDDSAVKSLRMTVIQDAETLRAGSVCAYIFYKDENEEPIFISSVRSSARSRFDVNASQCGKSVSIPKSLRDLYNLRRGTAEEIFGGIVSSFLPQAN